MEQVSLSNVATNSGEDSLEVIFSTPERINNIQNAKRIARGVDGPSKRHIADGLGALHSMCSNIQATQNKQGDYLQRLEEQMHAQIHGVLQQQSSVQNQLSQIENFLENFQADKGAMDLKSVVLDLRSTSNKLTAVAIQHTTVAQKDWHSPLLLLSPPPTSASPTSPSFLFCTVQSYPYAHSFAARSLGFSSLSNIRFYGLWNS
ncbi:hypothetical protein L7F22_051777 [Adiantum nelumboides]|nr:hypothetical protein [Adiantum nelumboides]